MRFSAPVRLGQVPVPRNGDVWNKLTPSPIDFVGHALTTLTDPLWTNEPRDQGLREAAARQRKLGIEGLVGHAQPSTVVPPRLCDATDASVSERSQEKI